MKPKTKTTPDLSLTSPSHAEAVRLGTEHFLQDNRAVIDEFKHLSNEEIKNKLQATSFPYAICIESWTGNLNISTAIRNANAFNAREVFYLGAKRFDRRGMQGANHYIDITFLPTLDDLINLKSKYTFVGIDNNLKRAVPLKKHKWVKDTMMIFGAEDVGLTPEVQNLCNDIVYIPQFGSVRSVNCAVASGIIMNSFVNFVNS